MKRTIVIIIAMAAAITLQAQHTPHREGKGKHHRPDIAELVSDLSTAQKRKLDAITSESKTRIADLRTRQRAVRDSISMFLDREGDHSKALFPLFDREAHLQTQISREMYATKLRIDEVLTPEQRKQLQQSKQERRKKKR